MCAQGLRPEAHPNAIAQTCSMPPLAVSCGSHGAGGAHHVTRADLFSVLWNPEGGGEWVVLGWVGGRAWCGFLEK